MDGVLAGNIVASAVLLHLAYLWPSFCCMASFIFLVPLFYVSHILSFRQGFAWGVIFYSLHFYPVAMLLQERAYGTYRMILYPFLIMYCALHSGIWFFVANYMNRRKVPGAWPLTTWCYFVWMQGVLFWVFDRWEGYPFALPIIPLAQHISLLWLLPFFGVYGLTALLICAQLLATHYLRRRVRCSLFASAACYGLFFVGSVLPEKTEAEAEYTKKLVYIDIEDTDALHPMDCAQNIAFALQKGVMQYRNRNEVCFLLPESAFPFTVYQLVIDLWQTTLDDNRYELILGTHKKEENCALNSLLHLNICRIIQTYEKNHHTIFTERTPFLLSKYRFFTHLFGGKTDRSNNHQLKNNISSTYTLLIRIFTHYFFPVLCSELFFNGFSSLPFKKVPILLLCNDNWFTTNQMKNLMFLYAKIYAKRWKRPIIYISHFHGTFLSQTGRAAALCTIA